MPRKNFPERKHQRRLEAEERKLTWDRLSAKDMLLPMHIKKSVRKALKKGDPL